MDAASRRCDSSPGNLTAAGWLVRSVVPTGPFWVSQKYLVLEKAPVPDSTCARPPRLLSSPSSSCWPDFRRCGGAEM
jgi:hypothetical protein